MCVCVRACALQRCVCVRVYACVLQRQGWGEAGCVCVHCSGGGRQCMCVHVCTHGCMVDKQEGY